MTRIIQLLTIAFFLLMVTLSLNYTLLPNLLGYDDKRVVELLIISAVLFWRILGGLKTVHADSFWNTETRCAIYILIAIASASVLLSPSPRHAALEVSLFAGLLYVCKFTADLWREYRVILAQWIVYAILLGAVLYMVDFYTGYLASFLESIPLIWPEPFCCFSNIRAFNQYQLWTLPLATLPLLSFGVNNVSVRHGLFMVVIAWWALLFYSASRGVILAIVFASGVTVLLYKHTAWPMLRLLLFSSISGFAAYLLLFFIIPAIFIDDSLVLHSVLRDTTEDRLKLWRHALTMIQMHPFLGVGPMHFAWYPNSNAHPHNSVLQLACEWGLPATFLMLFLSGKGILCWLKRFNSTTLNDVREISWHLPVSLFFTLAANACYSLVDGVIVMPLSQVMMAVVIGLMLGVYGDDVQQQDSKLKLPKFLHYRLGAIAILVILVWAVLPDLLPRILGNAQVIPTSYQTLGPRFWQNGGIPH